VLRHISGAVTDDQCCLHAGFAARLVSSAGLAEKRGVTYREQVCNRLGSHPGSTDGSRDAYSHRLCSIRHTLGIRMKMLPSSRSIL